MNNEQHEQATKNHKFDGIQEENKSLPIWWQWTFYGAIIFSFFYWSWSHLSGLKLSAEERMELNMAALQDTGSGEESRDLTDAELWNMSRNGRIVGAGQKIYVSTCASCHGPNMEGGIGLNLADNEWKNGSQPTDLVNVVMYGVLENGMPAWGSVLGERRVHEVVAYVLSNHKPEE